MFFNWTPMVSVGAGASVEGSYARATAGAYPPYRVPAPFPLPGWEFLGAMLRIVVNTNAPGEPFVVSLAVGGVPSLGTVTVLGPSTGLFPIPGGITGASGSPLSWIATNGGTGLVDQFTVCALFKRIGQAAPTRGLMFGQSMAAGSGPGADFRGMFDIIGPTAGATPSYVRLAVPFAGTLTKLVAGLRGNSVDAPIHLGLEHNGVFAAPTRFTFAPAELGPFFGPPRTPPSAIPLAFALGDLFAFGYDGTPATVGGIAATLGAQFEFPV